MDLAGLVGCLLLLAIAVPMWARTENGRSWIARRLERALSDGIRGDVTIGSLDQIGLEGVRGSDIVFRDESGRPVIQADRAELAVDWGELVRGHFVSPHGVVHGGRVWIETLPSGVLLIDRAFEAPHPGPPDQPIGPDVVRLEGLVANDVEVVVGIAGSPGARATSVSTICLVRAPENGAARFRADRIDASIRIDAPSPVDLEVEDGTFELDGASARRAHIVFPAESHGEQLRMVVRVRADESEQMHVAVDLTPRDLGSALTHGGLIAQALLAETMSDALDVTVHMP